MGVRNFVGAEPVLSRLGVSSLKKQRLDLDKLQTTIASSQTLLLKAAGRTHKSVLAG